MNWEYLQTNKFDRRFDPIVKYLKGKTKKKYILDLDGGTAPLAKYLKNDWKVYICNDTEKDFEKQAYSNGISYFHNVEDDIISEIHPVCDILLCLGMSNTEHFASEPESKTLRQSLVKIAEKCKPEIIILEGISLWEKHNKLYSSIVEELMDYIVIEHHIIDVDTEMKDPVAEREINILSRIR